MRGTNSVRTESSSMFEDLSGIASNQTQQAGHPEQMNKMDLFGIHDLIILGYYGPMMFGPHYKKSYEAKWSNEFGEWPATEDHSHYNGLKQARNGAYVLAKLVKDLHPVEECRSNFLTNCQKHELALQGLECSSTLTCKELDKRPAVEDFIEQQALIAWNCVGVEEKDVVASGMKDLKRETTEAELCPEPPCPKPLTKLRPNGVDLIDGAEVLGYRNFQLRNGDKLGACHQPFGTGGNQPLGDHLRGRRTAWLRACSYWSAFHTLALRADALAWNNKHQDFRGYLFGAIVRVIAGGALFCGG